MKILISEAKEFSHEAQQLLNTCATVLLADLDRQQLLTAVRDIDVLWVRLRHKIDHEVFANALHLKIVATPTTGLNHIDLEDAERRGIKVISLKGETAFLKEVFATAEHTVGLIFSLLRHIPAATRHVQNGEWNRDPFRGRELNGKTVGVVGYGRLGRIVARYLKAFGARILATDLNVAEKDLETGITLLPLHNILPQADILTFHVDLNSNTTGFFGQTEFKLMKRGTLLINTARGEILDENALLHALRQGTLGGAALDVICNETPDGMKGNRLIAYAAKNENLIITPHIGGCTFESMEKTEYYLAEKLCAVLSTM